MTSKPWQEPMPEEQFNFMKDILAAPSPIGLEASMTEGILSESIKSWKPADWKLHQHTGNAGLVLDTHPGQDDMFSVMLVGHADKIRMQVQSIGSDGKIWIRSDSFLPVTLIGHEVVLFSEDPEKPGKYRRIEGGTVEAMGAIHFADASLRSGKKGIAPEKLYIELQLHGKKRKDQVKNLGVKAGDTVLLNRPIKRGFAPDTFYGAYLDNGLGCFATVEVARLIAEQGGLNHVRLLAAFASHEEINRMGSRVLAGVYKPNVLIAYDVTHDYEAAPNVEDERFTPIALGKGMTISVGSVKSEYLNSLIETAANREGIPVQREIVGRDSGTDSMAAVFAGVDSASACMSFPIRNMHTISELGHTSDVLCTVYATVALLHDMEQMNEGKGITKQDLQSNHPRLDLAEKITCEEIEI